jgi:hypothetical protein
MSRLRCWFCFEGVRTHSQIFQVWTSPRLKPRDSPDATTPVRTPNDRGTDGRLAAYEMVMVRLFFALSLVGVVESFTLKVMVKVPFTVGFPLITPDVDKVRPLGSGVLFL